MPQALWIAGSKAFRHGNKAVVPFAAAGPLMSFFYCVAANTGAT